MTLHAHPLAAAIRGAGGGGKAGGQARTPIESPDSLRSVAYARVLDLWCEGEIYGFADQANPLRCVFFNETVVANDDGTHNFRNFQIDSRVGTQTQDPMEGFAGVESEVGINTRLEFGSPWVRTFTNLNVTALRVRLAVPALMKTDTETGDTKGTIVRYKIEIATDGGAYVTKLDTAFDGKASNEYERSHRIALPVAAVGWNLRVTRLTEESADISLQNETWVASVTEIIDAKLRMPMSAYAGIIIDAEQFNSIPSRAYHLRGRILRVPSNYDAETRTYTGVWDGTFQSAYSNNPAWVFYDMATNSRYGLGHLVPAHLVDKWALYKIAQYCDELVDDGYGGQEPRFTANVFLQTQEDASRVMQNLASIFRGIIYVAGGTIVPVGDMPSDPVYNYAPGNVIGHKFNYSGSGRKVRHTVALVSWNDMSDMGRAKIEYVEDTDGIARYGVQQTEVIGIGCTSRGQARRMGRYILTTERYETDLVTFGVGLDGVLVAPGKVIRIADPTRAGRRTGGRIKLATINTITVDKAPVLEIGDDIVAPLPDGTTEQRTISGINGALITVGVPFSQIPVAQGVWVLESPLVATQRYRVLAVTERDDGLGHDITAIQHVEGKFAYVEDGVMIEEPPVTDRPSNVLEAPTNIFFTQRDVADTNTTQKIVSVSWSQVAKASNYAVSYRHNNATWVELGSVSSTLIDIPALQPGVLEVRVTAINSVTRSLPAYGGPFDIDPNAKAPTVVTTIRVDLDNTTLDLAQEVTNRINAVNTAIANAEDYADDIQAALQTQVDVMAGQVAAHTAQIGDIMGADEWDSGTAYPAGDHVKSAGVLYRALQAVPAGTALSNTAYWESLGNYSSIGEAVGATIGRVNVIDTTLTSINGDITAIVGDLDALAITVGGKVDTSVFNAAEARIDVVEDDISTHTSQITAITTDVAGKAGLSVTDALDARLDVTETDISGALTAITALGLEVDDKADLSVVNALDARVEVTEAGVLSQGTAITSLQNNVRLHGDAVFSELFPAGSIDQYTLGSATTAEIVYQASAESEIGGNTVLIGNNAGDDDLYLIRSTSDAFDFDPTKMYRLRVRVKRVSSSGSNLIYAGFRGITATGEAVGGNMYLVSGQLPALGVWTTYEKFFKGRSVGTSMAGSGTLAAPFTMPSTLTKLRALMLIGWSNVAGQYELDYFRVEEAIAQEGHNINSSAITALDSRVGPTPTGYASFSAAYTELENEVSDKATSAALQALSSEVGDFPAGGFTSAASAITSLKNSLDDKAESSAVQILDSRVGETPTGYTSFSLAFTGLENTVDDKVSSSVFTALDSRVGTTPTGYSTFADAITAISSEVDGKANLSITNALDGRLDVAEGTISGHGTSITALGLEIEGKASVTAVETLDVRVATVEESGKGVNLLVNSTFAVNLNGWGVGGAMSINHTGDDWHPPGINNVGVTAAGTVGSSTRVGYVTQILPCDITKEYIASVFAGAHRARNRIQVAFFAADKATLIGTTYVSPWLDAGASHSFPPDAGIDAWDRIFIKFTPPATAYYIYILLEVFGNGNANPYGWFLRPMLEEATATQTEPSAWNAGGSESFASYTMTLDVNGYFTGWVFANNGTTGGATFNADYFNIIKPGGGNSLSWTAADSVVTAYNSTNGKSLKLGPGFGADTDKLVIAFGADGTSATRTLANAVFGITAAGKTKFGNTGANPGGGWSTIPTIGYSMPTIGASALVTVNAGAGVYVSNGVSISYNAGQVQFTQARNTTVKYYFYYDDGGMTGGTKSLLYTTSKVARDTNPNYVLVGEANVYAPPSGTPGGGSGDPYER